MIAIILPMLAFEIVGFFGGYENAGGRETWDAAAHMPFLLKMSRSLLTFLDCPCLLRGMEGTFDESSWFLAVVHETVRRTTMTINAVNNLSRHLGLQSTVFYEPL